MLFAQTEGIIPAPESSHAIRAAIDEALGAKEKGEERVILFNLSGHGLLDLSAYDAYHQGQLVNDTLDVNPKKFERCCRRSILIQYLVILSRTEKISLLKSKGIEPEIEKTVNKENKYDKITRLRKFFKGGGTLNPTFVG